MWVWQAFFCVCVCVCLAWPKMTALRHCKYGAEWSDFTWKELCHRRSKSLLIFIEFGISMLANSAIHRTQKYWNKIMHSLLIILFLVSIEWLECFNWVKCNWILIKYFNEVSFQSTLFSPRLLSCIYFSTPTAFWNCLLKRYMWCCLELG